MIKKDSLLIVEFNNVTGETERIEHSDDIHHMNWIRSGKQWGMSEGFVTESVEIRENRVLIHKSGNYLSLDVEKYLHNGKYYEKYTLTNTSDKSQMISKENFSLLYAYSCFFDKNPDMMHNRCNTHVWCAEDVCKLYSIKLDGSCPYLYQRAILGKFCGYGLKTDVSVTTLASFDRGGILLYPMNNFINPNEKAVFGFEFSFVNHRPDKDDFCAYADKYTGTEGDMFKLTVCAENPIKSAEFYVDGAYKGKMNIENHSAYAIWKSSADGEHKIDFIADGKKTFIYINVIKPLKEILTTRAKFITELQQMNNPLNRLEGAYLIYDRENKSLYCDSTFADKNAARERLSMGTLVAKALQVHFDEDMKKSLQRYRNFIEREIVDTDTGFVNNGVDDNIVRLYNFPWAALFYLELYNFTEEIHALEISAKILLKYYELGGKNLEAPCLEPLETLNALNDAGLTELHNKLKAEFIGHADCIYEKKNISNSPEVSCANGMMNLMGTFLCQAYIITGDTKYLEPMHGIIDISNTFFAFQPDYHMNGIALRYWDLYWFGKMKAYGDVYPQWLSVLTAQLYWYHDKVCGKDNSAFIRENLLGNCCVFFDDGFASAGYLYPQKVIAWSPSGESNGIHREIGVWEGKKYDDFANDQDWSLYYAYKYLVEYNGEETE